MLDPAYLTVTYVSFESLPKDILLLLLCIILFTGKHTPPTKEKGNALLFIFVNAVLHHTSVSLSYIYSHLCIITLYVHL